MRKRLRWMDGANATIIWDLEELENRGSGQEGLKTKVRTGISSQRAVL